MKTLKKLTAALTALILLFSVAACNNDKTDQTTTQATTKAQKTVINVAGLKGPTGMGLVQLMDADAAGTTANDYNFTIEGAPTDILPLITTGAVDIAASPVNFASTMYNKTNGEVQILCINTLGVLYLLEQGDSISSIADLKGKTIYSSGQGSSPEYILNFILTANGIDPEKDVTVEYKAEHSELAAIASTDKEGIYILPEPFVSTVTSKNPKLKNILNLTTEWEKACEISGTPSTLAMGCLVVRTKFAQENPEAVNDFLKEYKKSVDFVNDKASNAGELIAKYEIIPNAQLAQKAIPTSNITFIAGREMKDVTMQNLSVLFKANPKSIGGAEPKDDFYFGA